MPNKKTAAAPPGKGTAATADNQIHSNTNYPSGGNDPLSAKHREMLEKESSITPEVIAARGYRTIVDANELTPLGFSPRQLNAPGLLIPIFTPDGANGLYRYRPDKPRFVQEKNESRQEEYEQPEPPKLRGVKYEQPKNTGLRIDCPPTCQPMLADPSKPLWITEGERKGDALASRGQCVIDLPGVWGFISKNKHGGKTFNETDFGFIAFNGRQVNIVFDSDVMVKAEVRKALDRLTAYLQSKGAHIAAVYLPGGEKGKKVGVDDFFALGKTLEDLQALIEAPRPKPQAAAPIIKLLDEAPPTIRRLPLAGCKQSFSATCYFKLCVRSIIISPCMHMRDSRR